MMAHRGGVKVHYLTWLERDLGKASETLSLPDDVATVDDVLDYLKGKGGPYEVFGKKHVIFASVDGTILGLKSYIKEAQEITFFAPIVGG